MAFFEPRLMIQGRVGGERKGEFAMTMTKYLLASTAALFMTTGAVFAQGVGATTSQTTTTTLPAPMLAVPGPLTPGPLAPVPGSNTTKTEHTVEGDGTVVDHTQSYQSGLGGSAAKTTTHVTAPDGSQSNSWREEWTATPQTRTTTTRQTTTTTTQ
jgi:hypothetical protein